MARPSTRQNSKLSEAQPAETFDFAEPSDLCDFGYVLANASESAEQKAESE